MVDSRLRAYLWEQKSREERIVRQYWTLNGTSYWGYRNFIRFTKDQGFSQASHFGLASLASRSFTRTSDHDDTASEVSMSTSYSSTSFQPAYSFNGLDASRQRNSSSFAVAKHMFDVDSVAVTVVRFARSGSPLLAMGVATGTIKVATLEEPQSIVKVLEGHKGAVTDIDWSVDNLMLISGGQDGSVIAWNVTTGEAVRAMTTGRGPLPCVGFHTVNPNLFIVGNANGAVHVLNCSTGMSVGMVECRHVTGLEAAVVMACTPTLVCVGDARGYIHTWRAEIKDGQLQPLQLLCRTAPPRGTGGVITSLEYINYCKATGGPALLSATTDGSVCIWSLDTWTGRPKLKGRGKMLQAEGNVRAAMSAQVMPDDPQFIAVGAQDSAVEIFDISEGIKKGPKLVARLTGHASSVMDVHWSSGTPLLASCDSMGTVIVWETTRK